MCKSKWRGCNIVQEVVVYDVCIAFKYLHGYRGDKSKCYGYGTDAKC